MRRVDLEQLAILLLDLDGSRLHLHACLLSADDLLGGGVSTHLLLLLEELKAGQILMQLLEAQVFHRFLLNPHLVPLFDHSILSVCIVHETVVDLPTLVVRCLQELSHSVIDLPPLILGEEQDLVGTFDEDFLFWPNSRNFPDFFQNFVIFHSQNDHFVLENCEFEDSIEPGGEETGRVSQLISHRRRDHLVHHLPLNHLHLGKGHLRDTIHGADGLEFLGELWRD